MIGLPAVYALAGLVFAGAAALTAGDAAHPRRLRNAAFWALVALEFLGGDRLGDRLNGALLLALTALAAAGLGVGAPPTTSTAEREALSARLGGRLFVPALAIPALTLAGALLLPRLAVGEHALVDPKSATLVALALGVLVALALAYALLRPPLDAPAQEGRRLLDQVGWAAVLPQALAALGAVFALSGVGRAVGELLAPVLPYAGAAGATALYTVGMATLTMATGNAFAAFPVMAAGVGLPVLVGRFGGDPAVVGSLGMLSGFCGTLVSPMAANFNVVPVRLLALSDRHAVIRAQAPTAALLLAANTVLLYLFAFRR